MTVEETFGRDDIIHVLADFDGDKNVKCMTPDDFLTRCWQVNVPTLDRIQIACILRILGKQMLTGGIRLDELTIVLNGFMESESKSQTKSVLS